VRIKAKERGDRMYMDILVTHTQAKTHKWKYILVIVDEATNKIFTTPMKEKTEVHAALCVFFADMRAQGVYLKTLIADADPNFKDVRVRALIAGQSHPCHYEFSSPSNQYQNGPAESAIRTIKRRAAAVLVASKLPTPAEFFLYAVLHSAYHANYTPCRTNPAWATPNAVWYKKQNMPTDHLAVFGRPSYVVDDQKIPRPLARKAYFLGYSTTMGKGSHSRYCRRVCASAQQHARLRARQRRPN
jgi:hypothetical protein